MALFLLCACSTRFLGVRRAAGGIRPSSVQCSWNLASLGLSHFLCVAQSIGVEPIAPEAFLFAVRLGSETVLQLNIFE